jgi:hypothetical protein
MGLVEAAHSSWKGSKGSDTEATELRQELEARLAELATHGVQAVKNFRILGIFSKCHAWQGRW